MVGILVLAKQTVWPTLEHLERQTAAQHMDDVARVFDQRRDAVTEAVLDLASRLPISIETGIADVNLEHLRYSRTADLVGVGGGSGDVRVIYRRPSTRTWTDHEVRRVRALIRSAVTSDQVRTARWPLPDGGMWIVAATMSKQPDVPLDHRRAWLVAQHVSGVEVEELVPRSDRLARVREYAPVTTGGEPPKSTQRDASTEDWLLASVVLRDNDGAPEAQLELEISREGFQAIRKTLRLGFFVLLSAVAAAGIASAVAADRAIRIELDRRGTDERFRAITESVPDAIIVVRGERVVSWNPAAARIFGHERGEVLGHPLSDAIGAPFLRTLDGDGGKDQPILSREVELRRANGQVFPAEISGGGWTTDEGRFQALVIRDVSARKAAEQERARMLDRIQEAQRLESLGVLAGGLAHDFNNLLATILGHVELAAAAKTSADLAECLHAVRTAGQRASELVQQMLVYAGRAPSTKRQLDLVATLAAARQLLDSAVGRTARLEIQLEDSLPHVIADPAQVIQIAVNLVRNATEALSNQSNAIIQVRTTFISEGPRSFPDAVVSGLSNTGRWVGFEVEDNGPGIFVDIRARMFEPFFSTRFPGRGLGLSVVAGIVRAHGGALKVTSECGRGTTVTVLFPAVSAPQDSNAIASGPARISSSGVVLVIDDEPLVRGVAARMLQRLGAEVETADSGTSALEQFSRRPSAYAAVLLDWTMPGMDGRETLRQLRDIRPDIPVIVVSGLDEAIAADQLKDVDADGYLPKPFHFELLAKLFSHHRTLRPEPAKSSPPPADMDRRVEPIST